MILPASSAPVSASRQSNEQSFPIMGVCPAEPSGRHCWMMNQDALPDPQSFRRKTPMRVHPTPATHLRAGRALRAPETVPSDFTCPHQSGTTRIGTDPNPSPRKPDIQPKHTALLNSRAAHLRSCGFRKCRWAMMYSWHKFTLNGRYSWSQRDRPTSIGGLR